MSDQFGSNPNPNRDDGFGEGAPTTPPPGMAGHGPGGTPADPATLWAQQAAMAGGNNMMNQPSVGLGPRIGARLVDTLAIFAILFVPYLLLTGIVYAIVAGGADPAALQTPEGTLELQAKAQPLLTLLSTLFLFLPAYLLNEVLLVTKKGANIGKLALGQRVVDAQSGAFLSSGQAFKRFLVFYGPGVVLTLIAGFLPIAMALPLTGIQLLYTIGLLVSIAISGPLFQGWHDKFAGSKVVKKPVF